MVAGRGDGGVEFPCEIAGWWLALPDNDEECDGVGGPDEDGDNGSVTQSLYMIPISITCQFSPSY